MTLEDQKIITRIAKRAHFAFKVEGIKRRHLDCMMDIEAAHKVCPLRLADLYNAKDFDFFHDVHGIAANLNHLTGEIDNFFLP